MIDLSACIDGIRKTVLSARKIYNYKEDISYARSIYGGEKLPEWINLEVARTATKEFVEGMREIAEYCPLPEYEKERLLEKYRVCKENPWQTVAEDIIYYEDLSNIPGTALTYLRDYIEKHRKI